MQVTAKIAERVRGVAQQGGGALPKLALTPGTARRLRRPERSPGRRGDKENAASALLLRSPSQSPSRRPSRFGPDSAPSSPGKRALSPAVRGGCCLINLRLLLTCRWWATRMQPLRVFRVVPV